MGMGKRYWPATIADLSEDQLSPITPYLKSMRKAIYKGVGLFLWGKNSTGKTHTAAALCKLAWEKYRVASYFITAVDLYEAWKKDSPAHPGSEESVLTRVNSVRFLVIDDIGREYRTHSGFSEVQFGALLRSRSRDRKTTVLTTNLSPKEFSEVYGQAAGELAKECLHIVHVSGTNRREIIHFTLKGYVDDV